MKEDNPGFTTGNTVHDILPRRVKISVHKL
jgi:hypothetical protein